MKEKPSFQNIAGIGFRKLVDSIEDGDTPKDEPLSLDLTPKGFTGKLNNAVTYSKKKFRTVPILRFFAELFSYISKRVRVVIVIIGVILDLVSSVTDGVRKNIVKNFYWGRGGIFRFSFQIIIVLATAFLLVSFVYRNSSPVLGGYNYGSETGFDEYVGNEDVFVQKGSTVTESPQERGNLEITTYTVKSGDTLFRIAQYNKVSTETIIWANPFLENSTLHPGDVLKIPQYDGVVVKAAKGDTVYSLAKKYKIDAQNIADKNLLEYPYELEVGKEYILPGAEPLNQPKKTTTYSGVITIKPTYTSGSSRVSSASRFLSWPVAGGAGMVSQCYKGTIHNGVDIASANGTFPKIVAAAPGKVVFAGCQSGSCPTRGIGAWGGRGLAWTVIIYHGNGYFTVYGHLDDIYIGSGSTVSAGQVIGKMGRTGYATGTHLHFMVLTGSSSSDYRNYDYTNPAWFWKSSTASSHDSYCW